MVVPSVKPSASHCSRAVKWVLQRRPSDASQPAQLPTGAYPFRLLTLFEPFVCAGARDARDAPLRPAPLAAPAPPATWYLLGEAGKIVSASPRRFPAAACDAAGRLSLRIAGARGESVLVAT